MLLQHLNGFLWIDNLNKGFLEHYSSKRKLIKKSLYEISCRTGSQLLHLPYCKIGIGVNCIFLKDAIILLKNNSKKNNVDLLNVVSLFIVPFERLLLRFWTAIPTTGVRVLIYLLL